MSDEDNQRQDETGYRLVLPERHHSLERFLTSRCTLEVTLSQILSIDKFGPFLARKRHDWRASSEFILEDLGARQPSSQPGPFGIRVVTGSSEVLLAVGYPRTKLEELISQLKRIQEEWREVMQAAPPLPSTPAASTAARSQAGSLGGSVGESKSSSAPPSPSTSDVQVQHTPDGVRIAVPPSGLRRGTHGLWIPFGFVLVIMGAVLAAFVTEGTPMVSSDILPAIAVCLLFGGILTGLGLGLLNMARREAVLSVDRTALRVVRRTLFGERAFEFARGQVTDVRRGNSTLQINGKFVQELQILVNGKLELRMLTQRKPEEIQLVAEEMMASLSQPRDEDAA